MGYCGIVKINVPIDHFERVMDYIFYVMIPLRLSNMIILKQFYVDIMVNKLNIFCTYFDPVFILKILMFFFFS